METLSFPSLCAGVLYIEDFDEPAPNLALPPPEEDPVDIAPVYTIEDLDSAREEGRAAALQDHAAMQSALIHDTLTTIADALSTARESAAAVATRNADEIAATILALLGACLPAAAARLAPAEITGLLAALLPPLAREPGVELQLHPSLVPEIGIHLAAMKGVTIIANESFTESDIHLSWRDGEARRDWAALWHTLSAALPTFAFPADWPVELANNQENGAHHGR